MRLGRTLSAVCSTVATLAVLLATGGPANALPVDPTAVQSLTVTMAEGFATLAWTPVAGATEYQIERTAVDGTGIPVGPEMITGVWRPNRQVHNENPTFADAGFLPGDRFRWRVRALVDTVEQPFSEPVFGITAPPWGNPAVPGESLRTQWETSGGAEFTSDTNEYAYTAAIDELSARARVVEIGRTVLGRPINMFVIGHPAPPPTAAAVAATYPLALNCNVHGNEPGNREGCLVLARRLAFGTDAATVELLSRTTVLIVPTINGDGRAANTRGNSTGQDLNRDYSLVRQPETFSYVRMLRDYRPVASFDGHEFGNIRAGDLPMLPPRHQNVAQSIFDQSQHMIVSHFYERAAVHGWWPCPYGCANGGNVGLSEETILRNTLGLKNVTNSLLELRSAGGATRPDEATAASNRRRKAYSSLWTFGEFLNYHHGSLAAITQARRSAVAFQVSNSGRVVFRGSRPIPAFPAPHPGESPPPVDAPADSAILNDPPCAYKLTDEQYHGSRSDGPAGMITTAAQRIEAHGWRVVRVSDGYVIPLAQPERGLIPLLLDAQAFEELVGGQRLQPTLTGRHPGGLTISSGVACLAAATVLGGVTVQPGATLIATGSSISGPVTATGAAGVFLTASTARGPVRVSGVPGAVVVANNEIHGSVELSANSTSGGAPLITGNTIFGALRCDGNAPAPINLEIFNSVTGMRFGQCVAM